MKIRHNDEQKQNVIVTLFPWTIQTYQNNSTVIKKRNSIEQINNVIVT